MRLQKNRNKAPAGSLVAGTAALAALVLLPLYMMNGYVELIKGKFCLLLVLAFTACLAAPFGGKGSRLPKKEAASWLPLPVLCAAYAAALAMAEHKQAAFWGIAGRNNGLLLLLACTALYFVVREHAASLPAEGLTAALVFVGCGTTAISLANFFMLDPLDAYYSLLPGKGELFLGTEGNSNFYGALLCLCVPLAAQKLAAAQQKRAGIGWGAALVWLALGLVAAGSDAAWLGAFAGLCLLLCRKKTGSGGTQRLLAAGAAWGLAAFLLGLAARALPTRTALRTISNAITLPGPALALAGLLAALAAVLYKHPGIPAWHVARWGVGTVCVLAAAVLAAANLSSVSLGGLEDVLRFSDRWGSNRGFVWSRLWQIWRDDITWPQRLFGLGGDAVYYRLQIDNYADYAKILNGAAFDSAHSEYLQHLLCGGLVGLGAWLAFLEVHIRRGMRTQPGIAAAVLAYAVQAAFSISMPGVLPLVFVLGALCWAENTQGVHLMRRCMGLLAAAALPLCWCAEILAEKLA